jgi:hypothetical protein
VVVLNLATPLILNIAIKTLVMITDQQVEDGKTITATVEDKVVVAAALVVEAIVAVAEETTTTAISKRDTRVSII